MNNNPILHNDPLGDTIIVSEVPISNPVDAPRGGSGFGLTITTIELDGKLVNNSTSTYTPQQMQSYADRINESISTDYSDGGTVTTSKLTVESNTNPLTSSDHAFRIVDAIPGASSSSIIGKGLFGQNVVYLNKSILANSPATTGPNAGTGKDVNGGGTLERTSAHEFGHSATLTHPLPGTMPANLMNQTLQPDAGTKITDDQLKQIKDAYDTKKLNQGQQN